MKYRVSLLLIAMALIAAAIAGCGGGSGGSTEDAGTTLSLSTSTMPLMATTSGRPVAAGLDPGATVTVYNYATGAMLATGILDANGRCNVQVTPGLTVAIVITGTSMGNTYRLSRVLAMVPETDGNIVVDPITSMAAEAIAENHPMGNGSILSQDIVESVETAAQTYAEAHTSANYSLGMGLFSQGNFGATGSIDGTALAGVMSAASITFDNNIVLAKNAVQQLKEAGVPLTQVGSTEYYDAQTKFSAVKDKYVALCERMGNYLMASITGNMELNGERVNITRLTMGHRYSMMIDEFGGRTLTDMGAGTANIHEIAVTSTVTGGTYRVTATQSGSTWTITQTYTGDAQQSYRVTMPGIPETSPGENPSYTVTISCTDSVFTEPLGFEGTISAVGADPAHYTQIAFDGTLTSSNITSSGRLQVGFVSSLPANPRPYTTMINYPTSVSLTNGSIALIDGGVTIRLTGTMSGTAVVVTGGDGYAKMAMNSFSLNGGFSHSGTGLQFSGEITANLTNPAANQTVQEMNGTLNVSGSLVREGYPTYSVEIDNTLNSGSISSTIDLEAGSKTLTGTFDGTIPTDGPPYGDLALTTQSGVEFDVNISATHVVTGTVKAGTSQAEVGTVSQEGDRTRVTWNTSPTTYDEF